MATDAGAIESRVLMLPPTRRDAEALQQVLAIAGFACKVCPGVPALVAEVSLGVGVVVISEEAIASGAEGLAHYVRNQPVWSDLPVVVLSRTGAETPSLAKAATVLGNVSVLERPVRVTTLVSVVRSALRARQRQYEVRDHLADRQRGDEALRHSRDAFFNLVDRAPFGVYLIDSAFRIYSVNQGATPIFSNVRPLIGRDFAEAIHIIWPEPFASEAIAHFRNTLATGNSYIAPSITEERADVGIVQSYEWEVHRIKLPDEQDAVVCYFYESTKLRRAEAEVREARRRSEAALLAGEVGTYYWDIAVDEVFGDANFINLFGVPLGESGRAPIRAYFEVIHPDDRAAVQANIERTLANDDPFYAEYRIQHATAGERWVIARGMVERSTSDRKPIGWAGVVVDITDRKRAEHANLELLASERQARTEAEAAGRMKDEFLATLSHELRTPLNAIVGWSQILKTGTKDPNDLKQGLATIERNARAQAQIIEDLLDMSRIINGKVRLEVERLDLADVVRAAVDTLRPAADAKGVQIDLALAPHIGEMAGDHNRLQQVFWNLLSNAVKFTPKGGSVRVELKPVGSNVEVSVTDTGEGIDPAFLPQVFDRFRQADASTTRQHGGLGLGLAIVKQLIELHGGHVRATSSGMGTGATFVVALPQPNFRTTTLADEPRPSYDVARVSSPAGALPRLVGVRVLVVDDEPDARAMVMRLLQDCGAQVTMAASADEALRHIAAHPLDVLVSDIGMPGKDGYALIRELRSLTPAPASELPAIALTAYARAEDRIKAIRAGFQHHVVKPVEPIELITVIAILAGRTVA